MQLHCYDYSFFEWEGYIKTEAYLIISVEIWWDILFIDFLSQARP